MVRAALLAALVAGALVAAGCGEDAGPSGAAAPRAQAAVTSTVEPTDGRLGDATATRLGDRTRELSPGGAVDLTDRDGAPLRDGVGAGASCPGPDLAPAPASLAAVTEATLCLLNGERADHGLAPLAPNGKLATAATAFAQDLVAGSYFSHTGRDGSDIVDRIKRTGYIPDDRPWRIGENLAWGTGALATPGAIVQAWMNSPGHRKNILNGAYREIGIGVVAGNPSRSDGAGATYATEFGVIEGAGAAVTSPKPQPKASKAAKAKKAKRAGRKRGGQKKARVARRGSGGTRGEEASSRRRARARRAKGRGPIARIAV